MRVLDSQAVAVLFVAGIAGFCRWFGGVAPEPEYLSSDFGPGAGFQFGPPAPGSTACLRSRSRRAGAVPESTARPATWRESPPARLPAVTFARLICADSNGCPPATSRLQTIQDGFLRVPDLRGEAQLLTISFDPERDTVETVEVVHHPVTSGWNADKKIGRDVLTTSGVEMLQPIHDGHGLAFDRTDDRAQTSHRLRIYLVDHEGVIHIVCGRKVLFDRRLSINMTMSCAMCHMPEQAFTNREFQTGAACGGLVRFRNNPPTNAQANSCAVLEAETMAAPLASDGLRPTPGGSDWRRAHLGRTG